MFTCHQIPSAGREACSVHHFSSISYTCAFYATAGLSFDSLELVMHGDEVVSEHTFYFYDSSTALRHLLHCICFYIVILGQPVYILLCISLLDHSFIIWLKGLLTWKAGLCFHLLCLNVFVNSFPSVCLWLSDYTFWSRNLSFLVWEVLFIFQFSKLDVLFLHFC